MTEFWTNEPAKDNQVKFLKSECAGGRLRLVREGKMVRYLIAVEPGSIQELFRRDFGAEDVAYVQLEVVDSAPPETPWMHAWWTSAYDRAAFEP